MSGIEPNRPNHALERQITETFMPIIDDNTTRFQIVMAGLVAAQLAETYWEDWHCSKCDFSANQDHRAPIWEHRRSHA